MLGCKRNQSFFWFVLFFCFTLLPLNGHAEEAEEEGKNKIHYYMLYPNIITNVRNTYGGISYVQLRVEIMGRNVKAMRAIGYHEPRVRNDLIMLLADQTKQDLEKFDSREVIREQAKEVLAKMLDEEQEPNEIDQVLFTHIILE